jgi:hypothetical protein
MKFMQFKYTKANGEVSARELIVTQNPVSSFEGYDVSGLTAVEFANFVTNLRALQNKQKEEFLKLITEHDLTRNYRKFTPANMSETITEYI